MAVAPGLTFRILKQTMDCYEYIRLRQHYEAALRHWGHIHMMPAAEPIGAPARVADEVKQKALEELNAAKNRMALHKQTCSVCNRQSSR
jgi:hypothetical protein